MKSENLLSQLNRFIKDRFNLEEDKANEEEIISSIKKGIEFRGTNLWVLIFAIFIASIGLNVNSTAVIIGAMLISPLMGPIIGIGLGVGITDFDLIKKAAKNLAIAVVISLITSAIYFLITPLDEARSELLARTQPAIWDVFIAFFGGLAGIVASSRKDKSNVIPGVAIATALMPPLCMAGYGLSQGEWHYFFGALYLFFINSVFITFSTFLIVKSLRFSRKTFVDNEREKIVKRYVWAAVIITAIPSIYMALGIVREAIFNRYANSFIQNEMNFDRTPIISKNIDAKKRSIEVLMVGQMLDDKTVAMIKKHLPIYKLYNTRLLIKQGFKDTSRIDIGRLRADLVKDLYQNNERVLKDKDQQIEYLEKQLATQKAEQIPVQDLTAELRTQNRFLSSMAVSKAVFINAKTGSADTALAVYINFSKKQSNTQIQRVRNWLQVRTKQKNIRLILD